MRKEKFRELCEREPGIPIFLTYDWISTVARDENWDVRFAGGIEDPKGFFLFFKKRKFGFEKLTLPPLTPFLGPWIRYPEEQKLSQRYGYEKKVLDELIEQLPPYHEMVLHFHPAITNWLPFYWKGFDETVRYTYQLGASRNSEELFNGLRGNIRRAIRKAEKKLRVEASDSIDTLHDLKIEDYEHKGVPLTYDRNYLRAIDEMLAFREKRKILYAKDEEGRIEGGIYLVFSSGTCYYLIGAVHPKSKSDGAMSLLMWKGIEEAVQRGLSFDFEGSMIEPIERFFRSFGAEQVPYHKVMHTPSFLLRGHQLFQTLRGKG